LEAPIADEFTVVDDVACFSYATSTSETFDAAALMRPLAYEFEAAGGAKRKSWPGCRLGF
jgi:hypothetical protein